MALLPRNGWKGDHLWFSQHHLQILLGEDILCSLPPAHLECRDPSVSPGWCAQYLKMPG